MTNPLDPASSADAAPSADAARPTRGADAFLAFVVLVGDAMLLGIGTLLLIFAQLDVGPRDLPPRTVPEMDWAPLLSYGVPVLLIALSVWWFVRSRHPITVCVQVLVVLVVGGAMLAVTARAYQHAHPPPRPPQRHYVPCYSGSGDCPGG
ncbi:hypothetical protein HY68_06660 [Streptomyces sp. AcH 505]|uniref:DUF6234 family protein n=1 Tax=Streptomyces sp. AcH 505 TaxID=352211 RepID=UPI000592233A|nr:hypothetical protein HY68_06660 [Streptomyces sp. AcH 505]